MSGSVRAGGGDAGLRARGRARRAGPRRGATGWRGPGDNPAPPVDNPWEKRAPIPLVHRQGPDPVDDRKVKSDEANRKGIEV
ncbi:hypothetical protein KNE206_20410 [Kitasatospora sp. NE20-6]